MPITAVVDSHSHTFNAEDLPIDGFIKRLSPIPSLLTGIFSLPLDRLAQWAATGTKEADLLIGMLRADAGLESTGTLPEPQTGIDLMSDEELDRLLLDNWLVDGAESAVPGGDGGGPRREGSGLESVDGLDEDEVQAELVRRLEQASTEQLQELNEWLVEWGDPELEEQLALERAGKEGPWGFAKRAWASRRAAHRYLAALRLMTRHRYLIAADLASTYPDVDLFTPALVDFTYTADDEPKTIVADQIRIHSLVAKLSVIGKIPDNPDVRFHPFVGFCPHREVETTELARWDVEAGTPNRYVPFADPNRATDGDFYHNGIRFDPARAKALRTPPGRWHTSQLDLTGIERSLDLVRHAIELGGFSGVKIYPPAGFVPLGNQSANGEVVGHRLDAALRSLYAYCEDMEVPILTHASHSNGFGENFDDHASPSGWADVLKEYPKLRVCFGHFGHLYGVGADAANPSPTSWSMRFVDLIDEYEHVYADVGNSKFAVSEEYRNQFLALLTAILGPGDGTVGSAEHQAVWRKRRRRLMIGSDYWMNTLAPDHKGYFTVFDSAVGADFGSQTRRVVHGPERVAVPGHHR